MVLGSAPPDSFHAHVDADRTLHVQGSSADERIVANVHGDIGAIVIEHDDDDLGHQAVSFALDEFDRIQLDAGDGNDFVNIVDADSTLDLQGYTLQLSGGAGDNAVLITARPVDAADLERFAALAEASAKFQEIAEQLAQATEQGLVEEAQSVIDEARTRIIDVSQSLAELADTTVFAQANALLEQGQSELLDTASELLQDLEALGMRMQEFGDLRERDGDQQAEAVAEARDDAQSDDAAEASLTEEDDDTPDSTVSNGDRLLADAEALAAQGQAFGDEGQTLGDRALGLNEVANTFHDHEVAEFQRTAEDFSQRAVEVERASDAWSVDAEARLMAVGDHVLSIAGRLEGVTAVLREAFEWLTTELSAANGRSGSAGAAGGGGCRVQAQHYYSGGPQRDVFLGFGAPFSSWHINGGGGNDILVGGLAADEIHGGLGDDFIMGLKGNDLIHGEAGRDLLLGEFVIDLPFITGDDCVYGDRGIDLVIGDNIFEIPGFGSPGGDDDLHGGAGIDLVIGDDLSDIFKPAHPGGADTMRGDDNIDVLFGTGGGDTIYGGKHIDFMMGGEGVDTLYGIDNTYTGDGWKIPGTTIVLGNLQFGGLGIDTIYGGDGLDVQLGNAGKDEIHGRDFIDIQLGQADEDKMYGESGGPILKIYGIPVRPTSFLGRAVTRSHRLVWFCKTVIF